LRKWIYYSLVILLAAVFLISSGMLLHYWTSSRQQAETYDGLLSIVEQALQTLPPAQNEPEATTDGGNAWITVTDPETGESVEVLPEYAQLYTMNNDLVGWLCLPGTKLNYPVMQSPQKPDFYLKHDFYQKYSSHGCIYAEEDCDIFTPSDNVTLYGHYMKDGSMFAPLGEFRQKRYWEGHKTLQFNSLREHREYEIFAVFITTASQGEGLRYHTFIDAADQSAFDTFIASCKELSLYDTGITPTYGDKLITLSTCDYSMTNGRLVVVARQIAE